MLLIGVDYHPSFQAIASVEEETGECGGQAKRSCFSLKRWESSGIPYLRRGCNALPSLCFSLGLNAVEECDLVEFLKSRPKSAEQ